MADALMVTPAGFFMMIAMKIGSILSPAEARAGTLTPVYAVIGRMGDVVEEVDADTVMVGITLKSRFVMIGGKGAALAVFVANFLTKVTVFLE